MFAKTTCCLLLALVAGQDWMHWNSTPSQPPTADAVAGQANEGKAHVVVIRGSNLIGAALKYGISLDREARGRIGSGHHMLLETTAGTHRIEVSCFGGWTPTTKVDGLDFEARDGETYFFRVHPDGRCAGIETMSVHDGEALRAETKPVDVDR